MSRLLFLEHERQLLQGVTTAIGPMGRIALAPTVTTMDKGVRADFQAMRFEHASMTLAVRALEGPSPMTTRSSTRLLRDAHIVQIVGESYRLKDKRTRQQPLGKERVPRKIHAALLRAKSYAPKLRGEYQ